jgi:nitrite reductase/ring-hydroxylating ferredoxin subunit
MLPEYDMAITKLGEDAHLLPRTMSGSAYGRRNAIIGASNKEGHMNWNKVLPTDDLPEGDKRTVQLAGETILLVHHQGEIFAVNNTCRHMGGSLADGKITEEGTVVCPRHHSVFDLRTGEVIEWAPWPPVVGAVLGAVVQQTPLPTYPTKIEEGSIWVGTEEGA